MRLGQPVELTADIYGDDVTYTGKITSLGLGTGSAFALLPAQNASGNWIKIVQRVPVRIELDPKQVAEHPLRLGLSMSADVGIRDQGGKTCPWPRRQGPVLTTQAYAKQLQDADARIDTIISQNLAQGRRS
jgi:membrane fusion protein (multidrug efflux system)